MRDATSQSQGSHSSCFELTVSPTLHAQQQQHGRRKGRGRAFPPGFWNLTFFIDFYQEVVFSVSCGWNEILPPPAEIVLATPGKSANGPSLEKSFRWPLPGKILSTPMNGSFGRAQTLSGEKQRTTRRRNRVVGQADAQDRLQRLAPAWQSRSFWKDLGSMRGSGFGKHFIRVNSDDTTSLPALCSTHVTSENPRATGGWVAHRAVEPEPKFFKWWAWNSGSGSTGLVARTRRRPKHEPPRLGASEHRRDGNLGPLRAVKIVFDDDEWNYCGHPRKKRWTS